MKRINMCMALMSVLLLTGCDHFLDIKPVGKVIPTTYQDYRDLMTYAYESVPTDRSLSTVRGDELQLVYDDWGDYLPYQSIFIWKDVNPDENTVDFPWQEYYKVILNANQVIIDGENATEGTTSEINQVRGEAYLMRAYMHFSLAGLFSDVYSTDNLNKKAFPLATTIDVWKDFQRNTVGEVYEQIFSDIDKGIALLNVEEQAKGVNYRFSKVSAYGFAARVYAYTGNWDKALEYATLAYNIDHKLINLNSASAVLPQSYSSDENVLAMEQTFYSALKTRFNISGKLLASFDKTNDLRFKKYFTANGSDYRCALGYTLANKVSMRTAEFYLLLAEGEAQSSKGDLAKGKEYLKQLIATRLTPAYYATQATAIDAMDKTTFIQRVKDERFRELACQGFRWYDLRYWGKPSITKTFQDKEYVLQQGDSRYVLPFPKEAVAANPNLLN